MRLRIFTEPQQGATYDQLLAVAQRTERLGFDAFFRSDHYQRIGEGAPGPGFDRRVDDARRDRPRDDADPARHARHAGDVPLPRAARDPGRAGRRDERRPRRARARRGLVRRRARRVRIPFPSTGDRFEMLEEQLAIVTGLWKTPVGEHVLVRGQAPLGRRLARAAEAGATAADRRSSWAAGARSARRASRRASPPSSTCRSRPSSYFREGCDHVRAACEAIGRDPATMKFTVATVVCVGRDEAEFRRRAIAIGQDPDQAARRRGAAARPTRSSNASTSSAARARRPCTSSTTRSTTRSPRADRRRRSCPKRREHARDASASACTPDCSTRRSPSCSRCGDGSRSSASTGSRSGTTSTRPTRSGDPHCLEAITAHTALAATTERVTCGSLVYSAGYRHPAVLANAMATLDQVARRPHRARPRRRLAAGRVRRVRHALRLARRAAAHARGVRPVRARPAHAGHARRSTASSSRCTDAQCEPKPVQARLPIWIGGGGEKVTLRIAAQYADGWNVPFIPPDVWAHKAGVLDAHCERLGRDPAEITKSVNVGHGVHRRGARGASSARWPNAVKPGVLSGSVQEMVDKVGAYVDAGADVGDPRAARAVRPRRPRALRGRGPARRCADAPDCEMPGPCRRAALRSAHPRVGEHRRAPPGAPEPPDERLPVLRRRPRGARSVRRALVRQPLARARARRRRSTSSPRKPPARPASPRSARARSCCSRPTTTSRSRRCRVAQVRKVVDLWAERTEALLARPEIEYVLVFENRGREVGATIDHPHGQIYGYPFVPPAPAREAAVARDARLRGLRGGRGRARDRARGS